jgi:hypothetical protein
MMHICNFYTHSIRSDVSVDRRNSDLLEYLMPNLGNLMESDILNPSWASHYDTGIRKLSIHGKKDTPSVGGLEI